MSDPWKFVKGDLFVAVRRDLGLEFRLVDLRKLLLLRSLLCEGAKMIPQPGAAMLVCGVLVTPSVGNYVSEKRHSPHQQRSSGMYE